MDLWASSLRSAAQENDVQRISQRPIAAAVQGAWLE